MRTSVQVSHRASALVISMLVIFLIGVAISIVVNMTSNTLRLTDSSRDLSALRSATEGAVDYGYGVWAKKINNYYRPVTNSEIAAGLGTAPSFSGFSYATALQVTTADLYGVPTTSTSTNTISLDNYPGWTGNNTGYVASATMQGTFSGNRTVKYGVKRQINYTVVPLFQATAFFADNLELYKTATMTIGGLVHTNSTAYVSKSSSSGSNPSLTLTGQLSYVQGYVDGQWTDNTNTVRDAPPQAWTWSGYTPDSSYTPSFPSGQGNQANTVTKIEPLGSNADTLLHPPVDANGNPTGDLNPNDDTLREMIEPPKNTVTYPDPTPIADRRIYNKAGIRIHVTKTVVLGNNVYTTTITPQNGTTLTPVQTLAITSALSQQTIYDRREGQNVDMTTLDVGAVRSTLNSASGFNNILYIDQTDLSGNVTSSDPSAIRLENGSTLPTNGLTVGSQNPVYIQGDYNTTSQSTRGSAAVFADAVTILSNAWQDLNSSFGLASRNASDTTVNTAIVAGFIPSGWTNPNTGVQYGYSGGLNNFPRFLEDWSGNTFTYTGSMIELFTSQIAVGEWNTSPIYLPPHRVWDFDSNFTSNPPPGSLDAVTISRGPLVRL